MIGDLIILLIVITLIVSFTAYLEHSKPKINCFCQNPGKYYSCKYGTHPTSKECKRSSNIFNTVLDLVGISNVNLVNKLWTMMPNRVLTNCYSGDEATCKGKSNCEWVNNKYTKFKLNRGAKIDIVKKTGSTNTCNDLCGKYTRDESNCKNTNGCTWYNIPFINIGTCMTDIVKIPTIKYPSEIPKIPMIPDGTMDIPTISSSAMPNCEISASDFLGDTGKALDGKCIAWGSLCGSSAPEYAKGRPCCGDDTCTNELGTYWCR